MPNPIMFKYALIKINSQSSNPFKTNMFSYQLSVIETFEAFSTSILIWLNEIVEIQFCSTPIDSRKAYTPDSKSFSWSGALGPSVAYTLVLPSWEISPPAAVPPGGWVTAKPTSVSVYLRECIALKDKQMRLIWWVFSVAPILFRCLS